MENEECPDGKDNLKEKKFYYINFFSLKSMYLDYIIFESMNNQ